MNVVKCARNNTVFLYIISTGTVLIRYGSLLDVMDIV